MWLVGSFLLTLIGFRLGGMFFFLHKTRGCDFNPFHIARKNNYMVRCSGGSGGVGVGRVVVGVNGCCCVAILDQACFVAFAI